MKFTLPRTLWVALIAAVVMAIGTLMPWASVLFVTLSGTDTGDGKLTLVLALLAGGFILLTLKWAWAYLVAAALAVGALAVSLYDAIHLKTEHADVFGAKLTPSLGSGLILDVIAGCVLVGALGLHWKNNRATKRTPVVAGVETADLETAR
jgi:hypothetical protein